MRILMVKQAIEQLQAFYKAHGDHPVAVFSYDNDAEPVRFNIPADYIGEIEEGTVTVCGVCVSESTFVKSASGVVADKLKRIDDLAVRLMPPHTNLDDLAKMIPNRYDVRDGHFAVLFDILVETRAALALLDDSDKLIGSEPETKPDA